MTYRPATAADAEQIVDFWRPMVLETAVTFNSQPKTASEVATDIAARGAAFVVACEGDQVIGFATYFPFRGGPGYARTKEHTIILAPAAQGKGVGRGLMAYLEAAARTDGVHSLIAGVSGENPAGEAFHAAIGFQVVSRLPQVGFKFDRWMDLVLMQKFL